MARLRSLYDQIQYDLVVRSEKPHELGIRDKLISHEICNRILIDFLTREFPHFRFSAGIITTTEKRPSRYEVSSKALGLQSDIICYSGSPYEQIYEYVVVPLRHVKFTVETKKWIARADVKGEQAQLKKLKEFTSKPVLLVAFRHTGDLAELRRVCAADYFFAFSRPSHHYPGYQEDFKTKCLIRGQLAELCDLIDSLLV